MHNIAGAIPNGALLDCEDATCQYEQLVCPDRDNCTINCKDIIPYTCFRTGVVCPSVLGDCNLNCDDLFACTQANISCPQGNCNVNCLSDYSCRYSVMQCSGYDCLLSCMGQESCSHSTIKSSGENYLLDCEGQDTCTDLDIDSLNESCRINCHNDGSCSRSTLDCSNGNCSLYCTNFSCDYATVRCSQGAFCDVNCNDSYYDIIWAYRYYYDDYSATCSSTEFVCEQGSTCVFNFYGGYRIGYDTNITCEENSTCSIRCTELSIYSGSHQCDSANIICPTSNGDCTVECSGYNSCRSSRITCGPSSDCLSCSGKWSCDGSTITLRAGLNEPIMNCTGLSSCRYSTITCSAKNNCNINCDGQYSCISARVICPTGDYSCNIRCTDPLSCQGLSITNTHSVNLLCCGGPTACAGTRVVPTSTDCPND